MSSETRSNLVLIISAVGAIVTILTINMQVGRVLERVETYGQTLREMRAVDSKHDADIGDLRSDVRVLESHVNAKAVQR